MNDWYWASGDAQGFLALVPDMRSIVDARVADFLQTPHMTWMGWDDRVGNGFCGDDCGPDGQLAFAALVVRAAADLGRSLKHAGQAVLAANYTSTAARLSTQMRALKPTGGGAWHSNFGLHAAANAINAGVPSASETKEIFSREFNARWHLAVGGVTLISIACHVSIYNVFDSSFGIQWQLTCQLMTA